MVVEKYLPLFAGIDFIVNIFSAEGGVVPLTKAAHPAFEEVDNFKVAVIDLPSFFDRDIGINTTLGANVSSIAGPTTLPPKS